jgi:hypothetical protein
MKREVKCDKTTKSPEHHTGPFKLLQVDEEHGFKITRCKDCGDTVYINKTEQKKPTPEAGSQ